MANHEHLAILKQGVVYWNQWREQHPDIQPDLRKADLRDIDLHGVNLHNTNLREVNLLDTDLRGADLHDTDLSSANLGRTDLRKANLRNAVLSSTVLHHATLEKADLTSADLYAGNLIAAYLSRANLSEADLRCADLSYATLDNTNLTNANACGMTTFETTFARLDFREVKGLAEIRHQGVSHVELHSIRLPQNGSALHFLRGVGVPDEWIDFHRTQMLSTIQYHSCFISYSSQDSMLARRLHADLQDYGVRCWFAPEDMKIGDKIRARIDEAIHLQDKLLLLLSEHAIASAWIEDEVEAALEKEQRQRREVLLPVYLDESVMQTTQPWAAKLRRTRHLGDFTSWTDPQAYQQAFERLLRDLTAEHAKEER